MNATTKHQIKPAQPVVEVIKNTLSRKEADESVDRILASNRPSMTVEEVLSHAAQSQQNQVAD